MIKDLRAGDPETVGPYRLLGRLGVGGMGEVYLAKSPGGRLVAIKLIRPELAEERGFRSRFASEIAAARNVSGIYTAAVVDADADAELPWMATVYVAGPSLTDAVEDNGPLPVRSVLALAAGLAEALQAIHRAGLVHRDLKPSNVLLATDGPRVIDFGISLALERTAMTATGMVMGSPGFMSPEQARGQREVGAPTDMFSFGAVLAFAATGGNPFGVGPTPALLYRVVNEPPDLAAVPARLKPLIERCLAKEPADRPTPADVLASLGDDVEVLTGEWLPQPIAETMIRYSPTLLTPLPPGLREAEDPGPGTAEPGSAAGGPPSPEPTALAAISPVSGASGPV
ncbi:MAG: serine/threonine-protein kinase, partial [Trebonia sp.]